MKIQIFLIAVVSLTSAPAAASVRDAAFAASADRAPTETSMFVGIHYRVGLGGKLDSGKGRASLNVAGMVKTSDAQFRVGEGLGLAAGAKGKPTLTFAGQELRLNNHKANLSIGGTIAVAVVGVLAVAAAAAYLVLRDPCDGRECE